MAMHVQTATQTARQASTRPSARPSMRIGGAQTTQSPISFQALYALQQHIAWLRGQACVVDENIASMTHTAVQMGQESDWRDPRLPALDETISFWQNRHCSLRYQRVVTRALVGYLMAFGMVCGQVSH